LGLLCAVKRAVQVTRNPFASAMQQALRVARLLEQASGPQVPIRFRSDRLLIRIADRLNAPSSDTTLHELHPTLTAALESLYGGLPFTMTRVGSHREMFSVEVSALHAPSLAVLSARLASGSP